MPPAPPGIGAPIADISAASTRWPADLDRVKCREAGPHQQMKAALGQTEGRVGLGQQWGCKPEPQKIPSRIMRARTFPTKESFSGKFAVRTNAKAGL
jgi:hypothetical protein